MTPPNPPAHALNWTSILFLFLTPLIGVGGTLWYSLVHGVAWWQPALFLLFYLGVGLSVTAGYHRHFSHRAFACHPALEILLLIAGATAFENSALQWASDHRLHHKFADTDRDPYNINRGGWWAHMVWILYQAVPGPDFSEDADLTRNPRVMWQHRWNLALSVLFGFGLPALIGWGLGDALAGLLWGGFLRIVVVHHTTFFVNSLAHLFGSRPYKSDETARDNFVVALLTNGEGYHNFHHAFPADYRNGIRWYHWDPTKWLIKALAAVRLAGGLKTVSGASIEAARLRTAAEAMEPRLLRLSPGGREKVRAALARARRALDHAAENARRAISEGRAGHGARSADFRALRRRRYFAHLKLARKERRQAQRLLSTLPLAA